MSLRNRTSGVNTVAQGKGKYNRRKIRLNPINVTDSRPRFLVDINRSNQTESQSAGTMK